ncbi:MAG: tRNA (adenosine(37)-N6)-threonylcarbamoyltransferase complex dimerization subunit type 1 TsaB [Solirubrobacteraceae bacterium]
MSAYLVIDTATPATVIGVATPGGEVHERRHEPAAGERPGHVAQVLALAEEALGEAGLGYRDLLRIGVGVGPGSFTGLRIGIATARALSGATGTEVAPISSLGALAVAAGDDSVLAVLDARRGEAFVARWHRGRQVDAPRAVRPEDLAEAAEHATLAVGDGAVRFREQLEPSGVKVPDDDSGLHRIGARGLLKLVASARSVDRHALVPDYVRSPDAKPRSEQ